MAAKATATTPELRNIQAIVTLERESRQARSALERLTDWVSNLAASQKFVVLHVVWFVLWIGANSIGRTHFDPYPFNLLTLAVSLEAIILTSFVLMAQARLSQQADRRAHLDLQINLLAEQELTAILRLQCLLAERAGIDVSTVEPRLDQLRTHTNVPRLAAELTDKLAAIESGDRRDSAAPRGSSNEEHASHVDSEDDPETAAGSGAASAARPAAGAKTRSTADDPDPRHTARRRDLTS